MKTKRKMVIYLYRKYNINSSKMQSILKSIIHFLYSLSSVIKKYNILKISLTVVSLTCSVSERISNSCSLGNRLYTTLIEWYYTNIHVTGSLERHLEFFRIDFDLFNLTILFVCTRIDFIKRMLEDDWAVLLNSEY